MKAPDIAAIIENKRRELMNKIERIDLNICFLFINKYKTKTMDVQIFFIFLFEFF
jgi:hypothetical protein